MAHAFWEQLTPQLLQRFDRPGPRYTSYPTAIEFHEGVTAQEYAAHLAMADQHADEPLSLYIHLPFCKERCSFCGCHVVITAKREKSSEYLGYLQREIDMISRALPHRRKVAQYHWGGGTPTYYSPGEMRQLHQTILDRFDILPGAEVAIEVDPRVTTHEQIDVLREFGFNRLSMGVQDLTPEVQAIINRYQSEEDTVDLFNYSRAQGFGGINIDLIYGLPLQTLETFGRTIDSVIALRPDRVAMYSFAFVPWKSGNQNIMTEEMLPSADLKVQLYLLGVQRFGEAGYKQIGMDHFAVPSDELALALDNRSLHRNFMGYTTKPANDMIAFGASGIGDVQGAYVQNLKNNSDYYAAIDAGKLPILRGVQLTPENQLRRYVITQIMCNMRVPFADVQERFGIDFTKHFAEELAALQDTIDSGFVEVDDTGITITSLGRVFVRNVAMVFDEYRKGESRDRTFSRTI